MRLIDADAILKKKFEAYDYDPIEVVEVCDIEDAPTIEAEPVKHGRWTEKRFPGGGIWDYYFVCSECHHETPNRGYTVAPDYCPGCGAKMDLED